MRKYILISSLNLKRYNNKEKYIILLDKEKDYVISVAKVIKYADFNEKTEDFGVFSESSQVIYQPKCLYKNKLGVYYKLNNKKVYLDNTEIEELNHFIDKAKYQLKLKFSHCVDYSFDMIEKN